MTTIVIFPETVQHGAGAPDPYFKVDIDDRRVAISPRRRGLKQGIQRNVTLFSASLSVSLMLAPTDEPSDAVALAVVTTRSLVERWKAESANILAEGVSEPGGARPVVATLRNWVPVALQPVHDVRMWEFRPVEPPDPEKGKVSLHLQGVYGAIWLGDGTGADLSDATSLKGLGMRAQYAFNRYIAVEGELMGASTGTARFRGVTYQGAQGALSRSAALGRMQFGGVLRVGGDTYVPILRLGVGLQGSNHSGTLTTATGEAEGPGSFEWSRLFTFGTGLDVRLGKLVAGVAVSVIGEAQVDSIEAGIHIGYRWDR